MGGTPSLGRPRERRPLFGGVYVLVPIWLGAPRPAWRPDPLIDRGPAGFLGRYLVTVSRRHYTPSPLIVPGYGGGSVAALWKYRSMLDWTDIRLT